MQDFCIFLDQRVFGSYLAVELLALSLKLNDPILQPLDTLLVIFGSPILLTALPVLFILRVVLEPHFLQKLLQPLFLLKGHLDFGVGLFASCQLF